MQQRAPVPAVIAGSSATDVPPCFGVCCRLHSSCANYAKVDGADPRGVFMADCGPEYSAFKATP